MITKRLYICRKHKVSHKDNTNLELWLSKYITFNYTDFLQNLDKESRSLFPSLPVITEGVPIKQTIIGATGKPQKHVYLKEVYEEDIVMSLSLIHI